MSTVDNSKIEDSDSELLEKLQDLTGGEKRPIYNNCPPIRKFYQKKVPWSGMPDRFIVTMIPDLKLPDNSIQTTKYNVVTFVPKNLMEQFSKLANVYFLLVGILQMITVISTTNGTPVIYLPLSVILCVSALKDLLEDLKRRADDKRENFDKTFKLTDKGFQETHWKDLRVGDIIKVQNNQFLPADIILLKTSEDNGTCFVETKNLDGETNLKPKYVDKALLNYFKDDNDLKTRHVDIDFEKPNPYLYTFRGSMKLQNGKEIPLTNNNFLLRSCSLKSEYAIGMVSYTGHDTKIMLNSVSARGKSSKLERMMNKQIILVFVIQNILCLLIAAYSTVWFHHNEPDLNPYLDFQPGDPELNLTEYYFIRYANWIVLFVNFVPISLLVTLEIVKFIQAIFLEKDRKMVDDVNHTPATVQTSRLMEELGQVNYIFSDKTGTLTCNIMEFKKLCVQGKTFGNDRNYEDIELRPKVTNVDFRDEEFFRVLGKTKDENNADIHEILLLLSTCHTINFEESNGERSYSASSPDEAALVNFAKLCRYEYVGMSDNNEMLVEINERCHKYKLHHVLEFDSDRKRMSVIIETSDGEIILFCKGADSIIMDRMCKTSSSSSEETMKQVEDYANQGLRTLLVAKKTIQREVYDDWNKRYLVACGSIKDRELNMATLQNELELDLVVLGATAIEDKLQDKVGETIEAIKQAGIKFWVLTGDKTETAINIGFSCRLLDKTQQILIIDVQTQEELAKRIREVEQEMKHGIETDKGAFALVITGKSLIQAQKSENGNGLLDQLYGIFSSAVAVVACRVSPKQKRDIVELVKGKIPAAVTLAIGDGANDVNMITAAHIGIGIKGLEGYQAARASDFAIGEFKLLRRLTLFYGREAYRKNSLLVLYNFFKNQVLILPQFWYGFTNGMSGVSIYEPIIYQFYNLFYTSLPIIVFAVFDKEYNGSFLMKHPKYYKPGLENNYFNYNLFWRWFASGAFQAIFIALIAFGSVNTSAVDMEGRTVGFFTAGMMALASLIITANLKVMLLTNKFNWLAIIIVAGSFLFYILTFFVMNELSFSSDYQEFGLVFGEWNFYFGIVLVLCLTTMVDLAIGRYKNEQLMSQDKDIARQLRRQSLKGSHELTEMSKSSINVNW